MIDYNIKIQYQFEIKNVKTDVLIRIFDFRFVENDERKLYKKQILLSFLRLQLCSIDAQNDLYERIIQINRENENCINYRQILIDEQIINCFKNHECSHRTSNHKKRLQFRFT